MVVGWGGVGGMDDSPNFLPWVSSQNRGDGGAMEFKAQPSLPAHNLPQIQVTLSDIS